MHNLMFFGEETSRGGARGGAGGRVREALRMARA